MRNSHETGQVRMTVGELSHRTGVPIKNLRQYTDWGLIYTAGRSDSNYRLYNSDALWCVRRIVEARRLGLTLAEIRAVSRASGEGDRSVGPFYARQLEESRARIQARIADLQETIRRIDEFESENREELTGSTGRWWPDDPRRPSAACALAWHQEVP